MEEKSDCIAALNNLVLVKEKNRCIIYK